MTIGYKYKCYNLIIVGFLKNIKLNDKGNKNEKFKT